MATPAPPPGFQLVNKAGGIPPPPPGFQPVKNDEVNQGRGIGDELMRQAGLTGRAIVGGLAQSVQPFTEPVRYLMNQALPGNPIGGVEAATDEVLTSAGVPEPENSIERGVQSAGRFVTSIAAGTAQAKAAETAMGITQAIPNAAPATTPQLKELAKAAYQEVDDAGVTLAPQSFGNVVNKITSRVTYEGIDPTLHPKATAAIKRLTQATETAEPMTFRQVDTLRRVIKDVAGSVDKSERRLGKIMTETLDDYVMNLRTPDLVSGNGQAASTALKNARDLWTRASKSEMLEGAVQKAGIRAGQFTGSGYENALRTQFRQIAMNDRKMRSFTSIEQDAIKKVAMGGPMDNALRMLGKFAPRGVISGGLVPGVAAAVGGWPLAVATSAGGEAARRGATAATMRNVQNAVEMMRRGGPAVQQGLDPAIPPWILGGLLGLDEAAY